MIPSELLRELVLSLHDIGAVRLGQFKLHSGRISPIYLDLRMLVSYPDILRLATAVYRELLTPLQFDRIAAAPMAGLPLGTAVALDMNIPLIYPRKTAKSYGTGKSIEGEWQVGETAVIIDDLITSGDSLLQAIATLKAAGLHIHDAVVLIDREQGGRQNLHELGYTLHTALTLTHLLTILEEENRITPAQRLKIVQALQNE
ncbi:MAG: orotate phosphoribosyltransferase [Chloroflexi bacterium]|nr:MAG: orotate phosphoribosyltransferase [Chloroflexota bacterium]